MSAFNAVTLARFASISARPPVGCDHPECPAWATESCVVYGQDFYFCHHHANELSPLVTGLPEQLSLWRSPGAAVLSKSPLGTSRQGAM